MTPPFFATPQDPTFPSRLRALPDTHLDRIEADGPLAGALDRLHPAVAIVGTRAPCAGAERFAHALAQHLAARGVTIVSGGAVGIDACAHLGALHAAGKTIAVLPGGIDVAAPTGHAALFEQVRAAGALVALRPRGESPRRFSYFARNEVIAALVDDVVVVAAPYASGARNTAKHARALGRRLWVVPGAPWDDGLAGNAAELAAGARPLTTAGPLLAELGLDGMTTSPFAASTARSGSPGARPGAPRRRVAASNPSAAAPIDRSLDGAACSEDERRVLRALQKRPRDVDALVDETGLSVASLRAVLLTWTVDGVVIEGPAGRFSLANSRIF